MSLQRLLLTLAALAAAALFVMLGFWQLGRADFKQRAQAELAGAVQAPQRALAEVLASAQPSLPVRVRAGAGRYLDAPAILLDNQVRGRRNGLQVYRLFQPAGDLPAVLVDQGWIAWPPDRQLPALPAPAPGQRPHGLLVRWPGQALALGAPPPPPADGSAWLLPRIARTDLEAALRRTLFDGVLWLSPEAGHGFARGHQAQEAGMPPERHRGYAVQWFGLAALVVILYGVLTWKYRRR